MAINGDHAIGDTGHTADHNLIDDFILASPVTVVCAAPTGIAATDNASFQAALTAGAGGTVILRTGTYNLTAAPTITSFTRVVGDKSTILQCNVSGVFFDLTNLNHVRFEGVYFSVLGTSMTLFKESGTFNCSWSNILAVGTHSLASPQPAQICFASSNNSGDNYIDNGSEISNFGIGFQTGSFATYLCNSKISNCQYGIYSLTSFSAGMIITDSTLASTPGGTTISQIYIPDSSGKWFITNTDMEGATETLHIGSGVLSHGPTQFSITNCNLEGTTTILNIQSAYGFTMSGICFSPDPSATPTSLIVNGTGAPNGFAAGLTTNVAADSAVIATTLFPAGWNVLGKVTSQIQGVSTAKVNFAATTDPLVTSDSAAGYAVGSQWVNTTTKVAYQCVDPTASAAVWRRLDADVQVFTSSGTWTKPAWAVAVSVALIAAGGGGGAGCRGAVNTARVGGGGGGGGGFSFAEYPASALTGTVSVTIGAAGSGAAGQGSDTTPGANGTGGNTAQFAGFIRATGGGLGVGGGVGTGGTGGSGGSALISGQTGGGAATTGGAGVNGISGPGAAGGGSGGGISSGNVSVGGGNGSPTTFANLSSSNGGTAGSGSGGGVGTVGNSAPSGSAIPGAGGGGGGSDSASTGGAGNNGGNYGAGGGGGGASLNGNLSGGGGNGAPGICVVVSQ